MTLKPKKSNRPLLPRKPLETSWGKVADWYHDAVEEKGSYQKDLILPNLLRLMDIKKPERVLDLACGEGFFSRRFSRLGASVIGVDIAPELIAIATQDKDAKDIEFHTAPADHIPFIKNNSVDKAVIVLALQNIESAAEVVQEVSRVLKPRGKLFIVLNHPAFRIPKKSSWGWEEKSQVQYRRIDRYLSELREKIDMHPSASSPRPSSGQAGQVPSAIIRGRSQDQRLSALSPQVTISFHRPLQFYAKALRKAGFVVANMEEWSSPKKSEPGPRAEAENRARAEFPLFLFLEAIKNQ